MPQVTHIPDLEVKRAVDTVLLCAKDAGQVFSHGPHVAACTGLIGVERAKGTLFGGLASPSSGEAMKFRLVLMGI